MQDLVVKFVFRTVEVHGCPEDGHADNKIMFVTPTGNILSGHHTEEKDPNGLPIWKRYGSEEEYHGVKYYFVAMPSLAGVENGLKPDGVHSYLEEKEPKVIEEIFNEETNNHFYAEILNSDFARVTFDVAGAYKLDKPELTKHVVKCMREICEDME